MDKSAVTASVTGSRSKVGTLLLNVSLAAALIAPFALSTPAEAAGHHGGGGGFHGGGGGFHGGFHGGGFHGGGFHGGRGGRFWGGRWYGYGVGPCWRWNPFYGRWAWVCY